MEWLLSVALILACGVFVAFEFALVKIPVRHLERDREAGVSRAALAMKMKQEMNAMLAACQFGITLTSLGLTLALEPAFRRALEGYPAVRAFSTGLAIFLGAFLHVTFGELTPKGMALVEPRKVLYATAPFMRVFRYAAIPFIKSCNSIANVAVKAATGKNPDVEAAHEEGMEIGEALLYAHAHGQIKPDQFRLMRNVLTFAERSAREVMTPARRVAALDLQESWAEHLRRADEHGYSRYPVIDGDWYNVVGYVRRADVLQEELKGGRDLRPLIRPIERRPETVSLRCLNLFQGAPMIALYDEYDSFVGLLTAEDVVEQIVGEIYDETDERELPAIERLDTGGFRLDGGALLEEVGEALGLEMLEEHQDVDTFGGLVLKLLGRQPRAGDVVALGGYRVTVESAQGFRIGMLRVEPVPPDDPEPDFSTLGHTGV
jgi:CBS domain containing-hemolysin-like protein